MAVSNQYVAHAVERMARVAPVSYRRIFHGIGVYHQGVQFALIVNDNLYFRADDQSRPLYQQQGMKPFSPPAALHVEFVFFQLPEGVLGSPAELIYWMRTAIEAAQKSYDQVEDTSLTNNTPLQVMAG